MTGSLDVLLIESRPGTAERAIAELEAAGHHVHRCHDPGEPAFPCKALAGGGGCPLDGHVDVALLVRPRIAPRPTAVEDGVTCALRAGIPLVEQGTDVLDPFEPWVAQRIHPGDDVVGACVQAVDAAGAPLRDEIRRRTARLLSSAGIDADDVEVRVVRTGPGLEVHLELPAEADQRLRHALSVRVLDAVRAASRHTVGQTDVYVHHHGDPWVGDHQPRLHTTP